MVTIVPDALDVWILSTCVVRVQVRTLLLVLFYALVSARKSKSYLVKCHSVVLDRLRVLALSSESAMTIIGAAAMER